MSLKWFDPRQSGRPVSLKWFVPRQSGRPLSQKWLDPGHTPLKSSRARHASRGARCPARHSVGGGAGGAAGVAAALLPRFGAGDFFAPWVVAALRSADWRLRRAFFFTWPLRRFIFCEFRRSCFPTGARCPRLGGTVKLTRPQSPLLALWFQPVPSAAAASRLRTSRRYRLLIVSM